MASGEKKRESGVEPPHSKRRADRRLRGEQNEDAGLPDNNGRVPHKPGESPAVQERASCPGLVVKGELI